MIPAAAAVMTAAVTARDLPPALWPHILAPIVADAAVESAVLFSQTHASIGLSTRHRPAAHSCHQLTMCTEPADVGRFLGPHALAIIFCDSSEGGSVDFEGNGICCDIMNGGFAGSRLTFGSPSHQKFLGSRNI